MKLAWVIPVLGCVALSSCAAAPTPSPVACVIDEAKVMPWGQYHTLNETPFPNTFLYEGCGKRLAYVAAEHSNDANGATYAQVRAAMAKWPPGFVVLEGFPSSMGESPSALVEHSASVAGTPADAEPFEAVRLAVARGTPFTGAEPDDREILAGMQAAGLTAVDLAGFYVVRQIDQWVRGEKITDHRDPRLDALIRELAGQVARDSGIAAADVEAVATRAGLVAWYERINGVPFDSAYRPEDSHPTGPVNDRPINALSDKISDIRDRHIVGVIAGALERHDTVMVVYGGSHHTIQAPALAAAFGPARFAGRLP